MIRPALLALAVLAPALAAPALQEFILPTGLKCILVENHDRPMVRVELVTRWSPDDPAVKDRTAAFLTLLLDRAGAGSYSRAAFNRAVDDLGMDFAFQSRLESCQWSLVADSRSQEAAFALLADAVFRPAFDGPMVEAQRQALIKQAGVPALRERGMARFQWSVLHPQAQALPLRTALDRVEFAGLQTLHRRLVRPELSTLAIYGDLSLAQARELALLHLGVWGPSPVPAPVAAPEVAGADTTLAVLEARPRAELWAGAARPAKAGQAAAEELLAIMLARTGLAPSGKLELSATLTRGTRSILVLKAVAGETAREALVPGVLAILDAWRTRGFTAEDLGRARIQWQAELASLPLHPQALLNRTLQGALDPELSRAVAAVSLQEVNGLLATWLAPAKLRFLLLGGDAALVQAAEAAGLGPVAQLTPDN